MEYCLCGQLLKDKTVVNISDTQCTLAEIFYKNTSIFCNLFEQARSGAQNPTNPQQRRDGQFAVAGDNMRVELPPAYDESGRLV